MGKNNLGSLVIATALALGATSHKTHAQSAPDAILKTKDKVEEICALGITVREQGINLCDEIERQKMIQAIADEKEKHLYEQLALLFAGLLASGLTGKKIFDIYKKQEEEKYAKERDEFGNHGELSDTSWEESMESSTKGISDSTNTAHTGTNDELVARLRAEVIEAKRKLEEGAKDAPKGSKKSKKGNDDDFDLGDTHGLWSDTVIPANPPKNVHAGDKNSGDKLLESLEKQDDAWIKGEIPPDFRDTELLPEGSEDDTMETGGNTAPTGPTTNWDKTVAMNTPDTVGTGDNWTKTVVLETPSKTEIPKTTTEENDNKLDIPSDLEKILESNGFEINKSPETGEISIRVGKEGTSLSVLNTVLKEDGIQTEKTIIKYDEVYHIDDDVKRAELVYFGKLPYTVAHMKLIYKNEARLFIQINIAKA